MKSKQDSRTDTAIDTLAKENCVRCTSADELLPEQINKLLESLAGWQVTNSFLEKEFRFNSYKSGLNFAYEIGKMAEEQDHHPDLLIRWRRVKVHTTTHSANALTMNDFIIAAKSEKLFRKLGASA